MEAMHTYSVYQSYDVVPYVDSIVILYKDDTWIYASNMSM